MFLEIQEMSTVIMEYRLQEIAEYDDTIVQACILAAVQRVTRLLSGRYDVEKIFSATGDERDAELLEITKNIALWFLCRRCNVDILYNRVKEAFLSPAAEKFFNTAELLRFLDQHYAGKKDNSRKIWTIYSFLIWYEVYFGENARV